jgi:hypothetical protein
MTVQSENSSRRSAGAARTLLVGVLVCNCFGVPGNRASAAILQDLIDGASLTVGDKLFSDWTTPVVDIVDFGGGTVAPDFSQVEVLPLDDDPLNLGLKFNANGQFVVLGLDVLTVNFLGFRVSTLDGSARITDNSLSIEDGFSFPGDGGGLNIFEFVADAGGGDLGVKDVFADNEFDAFKLTDSADFAPQSEVFVAKVIVVFGTSDTSNVSLDMFTQRFSLAPRDGQIPEPLSVAVWCALAAMAGCVTAVRRHAQHG